jgi:hypothetical protein
MGIIYDSSDNPPFSYFSTIKGLLNYLTPLLPLSFKGDGYEHKGTLDREGSVT